MTDFVSQLRETVSRSVKWLNKANGWSQPEITLRILKIVEELGEAAQAWVGYTGQNPRKGKSGTADTVATELCDVVITALVAMASLPGEDWQARLHNRANEIEWRIRIQQNDYEDSDLKPPETISAYPLTLIEKMQKNAEYGKETQQ